MENREYNKRTKSDIYKIDPRLIVVVDGFNSRRDFGDIDELAEQIKEQGVLNPISVKAFTDTDGIERYKLIDGERRYRAVMKLIERGVDIARVPALLVSKSVSEFDMIVQQLMRNEGKRFNEYEMGLAYKKMLDVSQMTRSELAKKLGYISKNGNENTWRIDCALKHLERDERVQELLKSNKIDGSVVRQIYQAHGNDEQGAVREILNMEKNAESRATDNKGSKPKIKMSDMGVDSLTNVIKDTMAIKKGIKALFKYLKGYTDDQGNLTINLDLVALSNDISKKYTIKDALDDCKKQEEQDSLTTQVA